MDPHPLRVLVTGGTGTLGRVFSEIATGAGHQIRIMSRSDRPDEHPLDQEWARADLATGDGLEEAVDGTDLILHAASDSMGGHEQVDIEGTRRLLEAAGGAQVRHLVYPSIVGIDRMPYAYYDAKVRVEELIAESSVPHTTVRITQFHSFVDRILSFVARLPIMPLPTRALVQSIAVEEAAAHLLSRLRFGPEGRVPDVAGPEVLDLGEMARTWCRIRGKRRWVVRLPIPGELARGFREGRATVPERAVGREGWSDWLRRTNPSGGRS